MKTNHMKKLLSVMVVAGLALPAATLRAQSAADTTTQSASVASAPQLSDGASQILRLAQAKVGDDTIIAFIKNSGNSYPLDASQIIYLRQQGISNDIISAMLNQPKPAVAAAPAVSTPQTSDSTITTAAGTTITTPNGSTATVAPTVTYVQTVPATSYYYQPYYYPDYAWYPPVVLSFGWHVGGFHGGWRR